MSRYDFDDPTPEETYQWIPAVWVWTIALAILIPLSIVISVKVYQHFAVGIENGNTQIVRQNNQYVTSQQMRLVSLMGDYRDLQVKIDSLSKDPANADTVAGMRDQQKATVLEMRQIAATLDPTQVPPDISRFLAEAPR